MPLGQSVISRGICTEKLTICDFWNNLYAAATDTNHGNTLAFEVVFLIPIRGMNQFSFVGLNPSNIWPLPIAAFGQ